jgi:glycosyltransferase involved in cell wall biosynthesis
MEKRLLRKLALYLETRSISRWERALGKSFSLITMTSSVDEAYMKRLAPWTATLAITNGVDSDYFSASKESGNSGQIIFTGVMNYRPNEDAVLYFCKEMFPLIKREYPSVEFWVVGQNPSSTVQALSQQPGIHVTGTVEDIRPYLEAAAIFICPLRYGAGIKNKILVAMAMEKPVVATSISLEGIEAQADRDVLVADSPADFAAKVVSILKDGSLARRLGENGHRLVVERYSWKARAQVLEAAIEKLVTNRSLDAREGEPHGKCRTVMTKMGPY